MAELVMENVRIARKQHTCDWCHRKIYKGSAYVDSVLRVWNLYNWRSHTVCYGIANRMISEDRDYFQDGGTHEDFMNYIYEKQIKL